jgi:hypothetical protein
MDTTNDTRDIPPEAWLLYELRSALQGCRREASYMPLVSIAAVLGEVFDPVEREALAVYLTQPHV